MTHEITEIDQSPAPRTFSRWSRCTSSSWAARCSRREAWASRSACTSFWAISSLSRAAFSSAAVICCRRPASSPARRDVGGDRPGSEPPCGPADSSQVSQGGRIPGDRGPTRYEARFPWRSPHPLGLFSHLLPEPPGPAPLPPALEWHRRGAMSEEEAPTNGEEGNPRDC